MKVSEAFHKSLFWDVDPEKLDWERNRRFIIERVLVRGGMQDVRQMLKQYTQSQIVTSVKESRDLDVVTHNFCSNYFQIPKSEMCAPSKYY